MLDGGETVAGYVSYGRWRDRSLPADGEIDELYLAPEYQGVGFGTRLFKCVRNDMIDRASARRVVEPARPGLGLLGLLGVWWRRPAARPGT